LFKFIKLKTNC